MPLKQKSVKKLILDLFNSLPDSVRSQIKIIKSNVVSAVKYSLQDYIEPGEVECWNDMSSLPTNIENSNPMFVRNRNLTVCKAYYNDTLSRFENKLGKEIKGVVNWTEIDFDKENWRPFKQRATPMSKTGLFVVKTSTDRCMACVFNRAYHRFEHNHTNNPIEGGVLGYIAI